MSSPIAPSEMSTAWVDGPDAASFLHGLLSQDITSMGDGDTREALLLDNKGRLRVDLRVIRTAPDSFTLITDADAGDRLVELLDEYHFSEDVEIVGPVPVEVVTFFDRTDPAIAEAELVIPSRLPGALDAIGEASAIAAANDGVPVSAADAEARRVAAGLPRFGVDMGERTLVHEAGLEHRAVSFDKGCYLGQETVARVEHRGGVNKRLVGLRLAQPATVGASVTLGDRTVGTVTSAATHPSLGPIALATLRKEAEDGGTVTVDNIAAPAQVVALPFPEGA